MKPSIFVMIPSYRDSETPNTIADCFAKSSGKFTINIGVLWQVGDGESFTTPIAIKQFEKTESTCIRSLWTLYSNSKGCCWARSRIMTELYNGEDYVLSIDSHMRFVSNWDLILVNMHNRIQNKCVISTYPNSYEPPNTITSNIPYKIQAHGRNTDGLPLLSPIQCGNVPTLNYYVAAGFLFGDKDMFAEVPYDPHLFFMGEEVSLSFRLMSNGFEIWNPARVVLYHYYVRTNSPHHWIDNTSVEHVEFRINSIKRVRHIMGLETSTDPSVIIDIDKYGAGPHMSVSEYYNYTGILSLPYTT
jgi:hypothetical protein